MTNTESAYRYFHENAPSGDVWQILSDSIAVRRGDGRQDPQGLEIPRGYRWFFGAERLGAGEEKQIVLRVCGQVYACRLRCTPPPGEQVYLCGDGVCAELSLSDTVFTKITGGVYEADMRREKPDGSVREKVACIRRYIASKGFLYPEGLIENIYLCLRSKPFVLLAGISGTGKTRLVRLFAEALGATAENGRYRMVSVRPDWSDPSDLTGRVDINGRFIPGAVSELIKKAQDDPDHPYFLCLDEMNLARVEYYLSDFLSVIETRTRKNGRISTVPLMQDTAFGTDQAAREAYGGVTLGGNLYVIGTVNMDETTFPFSRKVLDRAHTVEFSDVRLNVLPAPAEEVKPLDVGNDFLEASYLTLQECPTHNGRLQAICDRLETLNGILRKAGAHVGYRVRDEIVFYLLCGMASGLLGEDEAFDNELMQKILPRIQGSGASLKRMLGELFRFAAGDYRRMEGSSEALKMAAYLKKTGGSRYPKSAEKIRYMTGRLEEDGFTSYWL